MLRFQATAKCQPARLTNGNKRTKERSDIRPTAMTFVVVCCGMLFA